MDNDRSYREIVENANSIILRLDPSGRIIFMNGFALRFFGYEHGEIMGKPVTCIVPERETGGRDLQLLVETICRDPEACPLSENENITREGKRVWVSWANRGCYDGEGNLIEILSIGQDITERKRLQELMIISEKMMTMGGLAAGMAHELNNPLGGILQNTQNMLRRFSPDLSANRAVADELGLDLGLVHEYMKRRGIHEIISFITASSERAADVVAKMFAFTRGGEVEKAPKGIRDIIERSVDLASCDYDLKKRYNIRNIRIIRDYEDNLPDVSINSVDLEQVLLNLLKNAAQAITDMGDDPADHKVLIRVRRDGPKVGIDVEDDGPGVPPELRTRVFEPFFTTKAIGSGAGLGLSVSYAIITNNHGSLFLDTSYDKGARFTIRLPV